VNDRIHLARDDSDVIPIVDDNHARTLPLHWFSKTDGPLISDPHGCLGNLGRHRIEPSGEVFPSVLMPANQDTHPEWHVWITLDGWDQGTRPGSP
jgi:hypothetical protein